MDLPQLEALLLAVPSKRERLAVLRTLLEAHPNLAQIIGADQMEAITAASKRTRRKAPSVRRQALTASYSGDGRNMAGPGGSSCVSPWLAGRFGRVVVVSRTLSQGDYHEPDEYGRFGGDLASPLPEWLEQAWQGVGHRD